ncbi:L,D-peptidoglycan transpeptidase YkuD, ErfK/YbiS/YcfS/YnhG family [Pseudogulbenkiania subflava DSM 22618]|uniref:L,D-peptidoglycan transpeptidase YkuD, ErfK/YbiS/YcfS/YnhG family n=2 Tax=Pseudogulbenkiania subflava TaxID=451637 RepID=A0A1Y6CH98_9NEIS|nr:L,D-peptidoglycan transpeptidase YkuD, ErfK/YbiS/YcfS/YnhG family [Pseudogulbenkiania subflava DSM 22618]
MARLMRYALTLVWLALSMLADAGTERWVEVDTAARTLTVYEGSRPLQRFDNISVGRGGVAPLHYHGDGSTPLGSFHIMRIRSPHVFGSFYQLDYPRPEHAEQAFHDGRIDAGTRDDILLAARAGRLPPQYTALGGAIGIHGVGRGSYRIHRDFNWTNGCVALSNAQLHQFARWAKIGMRVVIR